MPPAPSLLLALVTSLFLALAFVLIVLGAVWARLRSLTRPIDAAARSIDSLAERQRALEAILEQLNPEAPPPPKPGHSPVISFTRRVDRAEPIAPAVRPLIAVPNLAALPSEDAAEATAELGRRFGAIWLMADQGAPAEEIARACGQPIGQVELILGLRRQVAAGARNPTPGGR